MSQPTVTVLDLRALGLLMGGLLLTITPHFSHLPVWISAVAISIGVWRWLAAQRGWHLPNSALKLLLTVAGLVGVFFTFHTLTGRDAGVALLVVMMGMKLLEMRQRRDVLVLMFLAYFILVTHFLFSQEIPTAVYVFVLAWLLVSLHIHLSGQITQPLRQSAKTAATMMGLALPLMLALFVLFPRLPGPIWSLPKDAYSGMTGIDDTMSPGAISQLSQSDAVAFRVKFDGKTPSPEKRYWRGPVLWITDGRSWTQGPHVDNPRWDPQPLQQRSDTVSYTVTLEPHNRKWLFALDLPTNMQEHGHITRDFLLLSPKPIRERLLYHLTSYTQYNTGQLSTDERFLATLLPDDRNPRTLALGRSLRTKMADDEAIVQRVLAMYRDQEFTYTLNPPLLTSSDPTDEFLFDTLRGFCEHFASSFVMLMRAAGVPARVVTGYQGGELNPVGDYFIVRQRDAHAWAEVWLREKGWVRIDPTAAVAPQRVERSIDAFTGDVGEAVRFDLPQSDQLVKMWRNMRLGIDALNNSWNQWVLGYGPEQQARFLERLGLNIFSYSDVAKTIFVVIGSLFLLAAAFILIPRQHSVDPLQKSYLAFCKKLARRGLNRHDHETASAYALRVTQKRPDLGNDVSKITALYSRLRYGPRTRPQQIFRLKKLVAAFKP